MKTPVILICVLLIAVLIVYSAAAGMEKNSVGESSLSEDGFAVYLPIIFNAYQFAGNLSPYMPSQPSPGNGDSDQGVDVDLSWICGDPDGDSVTYDVYFEAYDSSPDILWCDDIGATICDPSSLQYNTTYYWQIVARDEHDKTTVSPVWVFKTGAEPNAQPFKPDNPSPPDGSSDQNVNSMLSWRGGDPDGDSVTYDVFFEAEDNSPDKLRCDDSDNTFCDPGTLNYNTSYSWQVVARDEHGASSSSPVWTFKTENRAPFTSSNPSPANGASYQPIYVNLSWHGGDPDGDCVTYDVYFEAGDSSPDKIVCNDTTSTSCKLETLNYSTKYYWQVIARDEQGATKNGPVWNLTTELSPIVQEFVGSWENVDVNTRGITRVQLHLESYTIYVHMWGKCHPTDCDWGEESTQASDANDGILSLTWNPGFAIKTQELSITTDGKLEVWTFTHFTDGSGREDYERWDYFSK